MIYLKFMILLLSVTAGSMSCKNNSSIKLAQIQCLNELIKSCYLYTHKHTHTYKLIYTQHTRTFAHFLTHIHAHTDKYVHTRKNKHDNNIDVAYTYTYVDSVQ